MSDILTLYVAFSYLYVGFKCFCVRRDFKFRHFSVFIIPSPITLPFMLVWNYRSIKKADRINDALKKFTTFK